jgi:hypothetical protein
MRADSFDADVQVSGDTADGLAGADAQQNIELPVG